MSESDFTWREICAIYAAPGAAALCLELQDRHGVDVCLLLFLAVADRGGRGPDDEALAAFIGEARAWHAQVIEPIRAVRKAMKARFPAPPELEFREQVKRLELSAEQQQVRRLAEAWPATGPRPVPAADFYLDRCGLPRSEIDRILALLRPTIAAATG